MQNLLPDKLIAQTNPARIEYCRFKGVIISACCLFSMISLSPIARAADFEAALGFDSLYITEGRDNLDGKSLSHFALNSDFSGTQFGLWWGLGQGSDYQERQFSIAHHFTLSEAVNLQVQFTDLRFIGPEDYDQELSLALSWQSVTRLSLNLALTHSKVNAGNYSELEAAYQLPWQQLNAQLFYVLGLNYGYVPEADDGLDHQSLGLRGEWQLQSLSVQAFVMYTDSLAEESDASVVNQVWSGFNVSRQF